MPQLNKTHTCKKRSGGLKKTNAVKVKGPAKIVDSQKMTAEGSSVIFSLHLDELQSIQSDNTRGEIVAKVMHNHRSIRIRYLLHMCHHNQAIQITTGKPLREE